ncbi:hypothetical protein KO489_08190 [Reinekea forsetii]|nr:hypothetical protein [Reinekea forsetii]
MKSALAIVLGIVSSILVTLVINKNSINQAFNSHEGVSEEKAVESLALRAEHESEGRDGHENQVINYAQQGLIVEKILREHYSDRIAAYENLKIRPFVGGYKDHEIGSEFEKSLVLEDLRIRSLLQKWAVDKDKRSDEEQIIKNSMVSYFPDSTRVKAWCIDDACVILMNSSTKSNICKYSKDSIFMGYSNCDEKHASHSSDQSIKYISIGVIYNSIEGQINALY